MKITKPISVIKRDQGHVWNGRNVFVVFTNVSVHTIFEGKIAQKKQIYWNLPRKVVSAK